MNEKYAALVPCYNVGSACEKVLKGIAQFVTIIIVVDDGSTDNTASIVQQTAVEGVQLLRHEENQGKGAALATGFTHLLQTKPNLDSVITLDGDGQHDPGLIPKFIEAREQQRVDLVYGDRMKDLTRMPHHRRWLNTLSNRLISRICRTHIDDSQCGFRLYSTALLRSVLNEVRSVRYEAETEILIRSCRKKFTITSVPISTIYSLETSALSHHSLTDVLRIGTLLFRLRK
jgi:glycosyltransferase involved in cell wall biosynthesis